MCFICNCCDTTLYTCSECEGSGRDGLSSCIPCCGEGHYFVCKGGCSYGYSSVSRHSILNKNTKKNS